MKIFSIALGCIILIVASGQCDQIDDSLSKTFAPELQANIQQMVSMGIDDEDAIHLVHAMRQHRFEIHQISQAQQIIMKSHQLGLPTGPLTNKALEGMSKQVAAGAILAAMEQVHSRYAFAYEQVAKISQQQAHIRDLGNLLASTLAAGIGRDDTRAIIGALHARSQSQSVAQTSRLSHESLSMARDIARLGVSSQAAAAVVVQALDKDLSVEEIATIHRSFITASKRTAPERLAQQYSQSIRSGKDLRSFGAKENTPIGHQGSQRSADGSPGGAAGGNAGGGGTGGAGGGGAGGSGGGGGAGSGGSGGAGRH